MKILILGINEVFLKRKQMINKIELIFSKENIFEILRFGYVGLSITLTYCILLIFLVDYNDLNYLISNILVICLTSVMSFYGHKFITFKKENKTNSSEVKKFLFQIILTFIVSNTLLTIGYSLEIPSWLVISITGITIPLINFILMRFWIFKK